MSNEFMFKRSMTLGSGTAESDGDFLAGCFIETPEYETLMDYNDRKMILLGRTGSGKTALLKMIEKRIDVFIKIKPDVFALQYISNIPFIRKLTELGLNLEIFYKFLWLHNILSKIIKEYFAYNRKNFLDQLVNQVSNPGRISQMRKYFEEYGEVFFEEKSAENITQMLEQKISAKAGIKDIVAFGTEMSESEKKEIQTTASVCVNSTQINQLKNVLELLKIYLSENKKRKIFVAIDDLDTNWFVDKTKYQLIGALLSTIRMFVDIPQLKIVIAMRADVFRKTCLETGRQNEKDESFTLKLNWNKQMLWDVLDARLQYLFVHKYQKNYKIKADDVFVKKVNEELAADYFIGRTMMRPRDLITFVNMCIEHSDGKSVIDGDVIRVAEQEYLHNRIDALISEWKDVYPSVRKLVSVLYSVPSDFTIEDLQKKYHQIEGILISNDTTNIEDPLVKEFLAAGTKDAKLLCLKSLVNVWYEIGVIGKQGQVGVEFATPNHPSLDDVDYITANWFEDHPLFRH